MRAPKMNPLQNNRRGFGHNYLVIELTMFHTGLILFLILAKFVTKMIQSGEFSWKILYAGPLGLIGLLMWIGVIYEWLNSYFHWTGYVDLSNDFQETTHNDSEREA